MNPLWICALFLALVTASSAATNDLVAFFPLRSDGPNTTGQNPPMELTNAPIVHGVLFLNGVYEPLNIGAGYYNAGAPRGYRAIASVPGLNYDSFTISLDFLPLKTDQRSRPLRAFEKKSTIGPAAIIAIFSQRVGVRPTIFSRVVPGIAGSDSIPAQTVWKLPSTIKRSDTNSTARWFALANGII